MAKSKRSKVKMAYKAMRRQVLEKSHDAKVRKLAARTYRALELPLPAERADGDRMESRTHNGMVLVSTFTPTPALPKLNIVHGPLAGAKEESDDEAACEVLPPKDEAMQVEPAKEARMEYAARPYFYPKRRRKGKRGAELNRPPRPTRHPGNQPSIEL